MASAQKPATRKTKPGGRSMTFTGCWTCKRRKVKCDERPQVCANCERMAIPCDGYGVKLQWMADMFAALHPGGDAGQTQTQTQTQTQSQSQTQSKGRIRIAPSSAAVYPMAAIDEFLSTLERDASCVGDQPSQRGPFTVFPVHGMECAVSSPSASIPNASRSRPPEATSPATTELSITSDAPVSRFTQLETPLLPDTGSATSSTPYTTTMVIPRSTFTQVSGDTTVNRLMHHYVVHVAGLLQPIDHPQNPYRTLYVPAALTAAAGPLGRALAMADPDTAIQAVLLHSLMSSASFHLWNCNPARAEFHKLGAQQRRESLRLLNAALVRHSSSIDYQTLMMAMLSLVSIDIMSGCEADFVIHLRGTKQLQQRRTGFRIMSRATRQLHQISDFLFLLARTTWFPASLAELAASPYDVGTTCGDADDYDYATDKSRDRMADSCYPYMYGISPTLASYMDETCRRAEDLVRHRLQHGRAVPPPEPLLEACERLGDRILAWTHALEDDDSGGILSSTNDPLARAIFQPHVQAWHRALVIYYFRRIHGTHAPDHAEHVRTIAACMHAVEDIKERALSSTRALTLPMARGASVGMAPITWPAFIASCEGLHRDVWTHWWQRVQCYQIANIRRQWEMVTMLWAHQDGMAQAGEGASFDWTRAFRGYELTLIPI